MKRPSSRTVLLSIVSSSILNSSPVFAQDAAVKQPEGESQATEGKTKPKTERIQITGSRLKRSDVEGLSAVVEVDAEAIQKSGVNTVGEVLQNMTLSIDGAYGSATVDDQRGNVTNANIRGLGADNTLILLDGRRLPDEGGTGVVDLSQFPIAAIERIEVLKESASAIYGSDAAGGVINIITKKDFEGSAVMARVADPSGKGGTETGLSVVNGVNSDNLKLLTALSYRHIAPVFWRDRDWSRDGVSTYSLPGNIGLTTATQPNGDPILDENGAQTTKTAYYAAGSCPPELKRNDGQCTYNYANQMAFSPEVKQLGFLSNLDYKLSDTLNLFATLRAQRNQNLWNMAPNAGNFTIASATLAAHPNFNTSGVPLVPGRDADVKYRAAAWGNRTWEETNNIFGGTIGIKGQLSNDWEWNASFGRSESKKDSKSPEGFLLTKPVSDAIASGAFDPFETNFSNPAVASLVASSHYEPTVVNKTRMNTYDLSLTGDVFELEGGKAGLAVGLSRFDQYYSLNIDRESETNSVFGVLQNKSASGDRTVTALFAELLMPFTKTFEVQVAARHDQYSDFGSTTNPKLGFKYKPVAGLMLRANAGTGFKAPTLKQIYDAGSITYKNLYDKPNIATSPARQDEIEIETYGDKNLKEETSFGWSAGFVADPSERLSLSLDYWYLRINDVITPVDAQRALDAAAEGTPLPGIDIVHVNGDPTGPLKTIRVPTANLGKAENAGVDVLTQYQVPIDTIRVTLTNDYSRKFYSKIVPYPGADQRNYLNDRGHPAWRMVNTGTAGAGGHDFTLRNNIIAKQDKTPTTTTTGYMGSFSTYDVQYQWTHPWKGAVAVGAVNLLNKKFPRDDTERLGDDQRVEEIFSANGRMIYMNVNQSF